MASKCCFLDLPVETRLQIYEMVFYRRLDIDLQRSEDISKLRAIGWLFDVDTSLLMVKRQICKESMAVAFSCNTFTWQCMPLFFYSISLRYYLRHIKNILVDELSLDIMSITNPFNLERDTNEKYFSRRLTRVFVHLRTYKRPHTSLSSCAIEELNETGNWVSVVQYFRSLRNVTVTFLRRGVRIEALDKALEDKFPGCLMTDGEERNYVVFSEMRRTGLR